jgi:hypothetical protein
VTEPNADPSPVARFFGGLLMAVGGLIAVTSGLCSLAILTMGAVSSGNDLGDSIPLVLLVGGIPFGIGLALFFIGRRLYRGSPPNQRHGIQ